MLILNCVAIIGLMKDRKSRGEIGDMIGGMYRNNITPTKIIYYPSYNVAHAHSLTGRHGITDLASHTTGK